MAVIKRGQIICELVCPSIEKFNISYKALKAASTKLPVRTKIQLNLY
jgi:ribosomal protein L16/L10AE